jgi:small subunit ribosomal protein S5
MRNYQEREPKEFEETVVEIRRVSKKTKGGNTIRFSALVVVGDRKGRVGVGLSKAPDVRSAIIKSVGFAKRRLISIPIKGTTLPYSVETKFSAARVILKPAPAGSGIVAGGAMRVVLEAAGVKDAVGKILGTRNKTSNVYATMEALKKIAKLDKSRNFKITKSQKSTKTQKGGIAKTSKQNSKKVQNKGKTLKVKKSRASNTSRASKK